MQRIPLFILVLIIAIVVVKIPAFPQESGTSQKCMGKICTVQENLRALDELTKDMDKTLKRIEQACDKSGYKVCFNPATNDVAAWHKIHARMDDIAKILEERHASDAKIRHFNQIEPAAGPNPYTNPDQEQLDKNKKSWWRDNGWSPPQENNPYHKW